MGLLASIAAIGCGESSDASSEPRPSDAGSDAPVQDGAFSDAPNDTNAPEAGDAEDADAADASEDTGATGDGGTCGPADPYPSLLTDVAGLSARRGTIQFEARDGNTITAFTYRASGFDGTGPIVFVMHGAGRTAESYLQAFVPIAERHGALAIAPLFDEQRYPSSDDYTLGVGTSGAPYGGAFEPTEWRAPT